MFHSYLNTEHGKASDLFLPMQAHSEAIPAGETSSESATRTLARHAFCMTLDELLHEMR